MDRRRPLFDLSVRASVLATLLFAVLTVLVASGWLEPLDSWATSLRVWLGPEANAWFALPFILLGSVEVTGLLTAGIIFFFCRSRRLALAVAAFFVVANVVEMLFKATLSHPNPPILQTLGGPRLPESALLPLLIASKLHIIPSAVLLNSYPSGHMARTVFVGLLLGALFPIAGLRRTVLILLVLVAVAMALGGGHWPSDVVAGALLGWACAAAAWALPHRHPLDAESSRRTGSSPVQSGVGGPSA